MNSLELTKRAVNLSAHSKQFDVHTSSVRYDSAKKMAKRCNKFVKDVLLKEDGLFQNQLRNSTIHSVCQILRKDSFNAFNFLQTMDYHGHVLSLKAISVVRYMQNLDPYSRDSIFDSASTISRCSTRIIERYGKLVDYNLSYVSDELVGGDYLTFRID